MCLHSASMQCPLTESPGGIDSSWLDSPGHSGFYGIFIAFALNEGKILDFFNPFAHCFFSRKEV